MLGEALGGILCVYDLWAHKKKALGGINEEAIDVSMIGGSMYAIMPLNASQYLQN